MAVSKLKISLAQKNVAFFFSFFGLHFFAKALAEYPEDFDGLM